MFRQLVPCATDGVLTASITIGGGGAVGGTGILTVGIMAVTSAHRGGKKYLTPTDGYIYRRWCRGSSHWWKRNVGETGRVHSGHRRLRLQTAIQGEPTPWLGGKERRMRKQRGRGRGFVFSLEPALSKGNINRPYIRWTSAEPIIVSSFAWILWRDGN